MTVQYRDANGTVHRFEERDAETPGETNTVLTLPASVVAYLAKLDGIDSKLGASLTVGLPTGASTSALQTSGNTKLDTLHADLATLHTDLGTIDTRVDGLEALVAATNAALAATLVVQPAAATTGAATSVAMSTASATLIGANSARVGLLIYNPLNVDLYVRFENADAAAIQSVNVAPRGAYELPRKYYTGIVKAAVSSGSGNVFVTEFT